VAFLFSKRWLLFFVSVGLLAYGAWWLGQWQFHRLEDRKESNSTVSKNLAALPVPVSDLMSTDRQPGVKDEWREVTVHGHWDDDNTIVLKYQTRDSAAGIDVVTPLITQSGDAVLVNRGWMETGNSGSSRPATPNASPGEVTVTGWVRRDGTGSATRVADMSTRAISSVEIEKVLPYQLFRGFLELKDETPPPTTALGAAELPDDTSEGPHFFYGLQWWFFGFLALFGFVYLAVDEWAQRRRILKELDEEEESQQ
jgi:cytochrome oxidase assembly protein ShyY1